MDKAIEMRLEGLARLSHTASAASAVPCKVCGGSAPFFDVVDFNKVAGETNYYAFGPSGVHVNYHRCGECGFLFTNFFDDWQTNDFRRFIYNPDYGSVDSEYSGARPRRTAERMANLLRDLEHLRVLDYGAGSGIFAECMVERGFPHVDGFDPFSQPNRPDAKFDVIVCNEVLEHSPDPLGTMRDMRSFLSDDGCIILGQSLQPPDIERVRASWWYCAPRNGHCSTFAERTLSTIAANLGLLFHRGGTLVFRPHRASKGIEIARRVNSPEPYLCTTLGVPGMLPCENLHSRENGPGGPFRWTAQQCQTWTINVNSDGPASVQVRIPFVMEVEAGFAAKSQMTIGGKPAQVSIMESAIVAESQGVESGEITVSLLMADHKSPAELRGVPDSRMLGLALVVASD